MRKQSSFVSCPTLIRVGSTNIQIKGNYRVVFHNSVFQTWNFLSFSFGKTVFRHGISNINFLLSSGAIIVKLLVKVDMWSCLASAPLTFKDYDAWQLIPTYQLPAGIKCCNPIVPITLLVKQEGIE